MPGPDRSLAMTPGIATTGVTSHKPTIFNLPVVYSTLADVAAERIPRGHTRDIWPPSFHYVSDGLESAWTLAVVAFLWFLEVAGWIAGHTQRSLALHALRLYRSRFHEVKIILSVRSVRLSSGLAHEATRICQQARMAVAKDACDSKCEDLREQVRTWLNERPWHGMCFDISSVQNVKHQQQIYGSGAASHDLRSKLASLLAYPCLSTVFRTLFRRSASSIIVLA